MFNRWDNFLTIVDTLGRFTPFCKVYPLIFQQGENHRGVTIHVTSMTSTWGYHTMNMQHVTP